MVPLSLLPSCLPFYRMSKNTHHLTSFFPCIWDSMSPIYCPSLGPNFFSFLLILSSIQELHFSLILLTSIYLHLLLTSKEINDRPCLPLPCWRYNHLLFGSTHLSPKKGSENWGLFASARRFHQMGFFPNAENIWKWATLEKYLKMLNHCRIFILLRRFLW